MSENELGDGEWINRPAAAKGDCRVGNRITRYGNTKKAGALGASGVRLRVERKKDVKTGARCNGAMNGAGEKFKRRNQERGKGVGRCNRKRKRRRGGT